MSFIHSTKNVVLLILILIVTAGGVGAWFAYTPKSTVTNQTKILYDLSRNETPRKICDDLEKQGVISDSQKLYWIGKILGYWGKLKAAEYELSSSYSPIEILHVLISGKGFQHPFLVREGENIYQIADRFQEFKITTKEDALQWMKSIDFMKQLGIPEPFPRTLEGFLSPNTYYYVKGDTAELILRRMVQRFFQLWKPEFDVRAKMLGLSRMQVLTLASMIEKETAAPWERPKVSSVFHNRLQKKMKLQSDPTTIYGIWDHYDGTIHKIDLLTPTEYNTYTIPGLPPGPIANPSIEAIRAALYPDTSKFLYFVSRNDGTHEFSENYEQHVQFVKKFQLDNHRNP